MQRFTLAAAIVAVRDLLVRVGDEAGRPAPGGRLVLALDGRSGAGKTTLAAGIAAFVAGEREVVTLSMDSVYPGWDGLDAGADRLVTDVLRPLAAGEPVGTRRWDWQRAVDGPWQPLNVPVGGLLIIEGAGAAVSAAAAYLSAVVWVDGDEAVRRERAIDRDGDTYGPHWQRWAAQEDDYSRRESVARRADLVIGALVAEPATEPATEAVRRG